MPGSHAILSPSGASRWLACTPSARLEEQFPDKSGEAAAEGTHAHSLAELLLRHQTGSVTKAAFNKLHGKLKESSYYDAAMQDHCENYAAYVLEQFNLAKSHTSDALLFLEQKLDLTEYVPEGFGTGDAIIIADKVMNIIDLKYGKGVPVTAVENRQMMLYALGAYHLYSLLYNVEHVKMTIFQPRIDNISEWQIDVTELLDWSERELKPKAKLAYDGEGEYAPGSHCRFCKARAVCKANADFNLQLAEYDFKQPALLEDGEVAHILDRADTFSQWLKDVQEHALNEAVNNGKKWPGYKLVEGRSNRKYTDPKLVLSTLTGSGYPAENISKTEPLGITEMERVLGKTIFSDLLNNLVAKPPGKPTLAPLSDKRPEYNSAESAANDFSE
ncbi:DUF2800 domain-containing protein [Candidatus Dependentiae bacterium]|nr:DUF2800 domain-containing protein [Candidatus Dependentiae bacterium]